LRTGRAVLILALAVIWALPVPAQSVSGHVYEDRDADGIQDVDEPAIADISVRLFGTPSAGGSLDQSIATASDGGFSFTPGDGCYLLAPWDPPGWRPTLSRRDVYAQTTPGYSFPVGQPRLTKLDQAITNLSLGQLRYSALGDSIARNFNILCGSSTFWYSRQLRARLACVAPLATIPSVDEAAVLGEHTDDLLVDESNDLNNVFRLIEIQPQLVSLSMIGNDLLDVDPGDGGSQQDVNRAVAEVLDARQNLQEALSAIVSEVPHADIVLNTLYDNEAHSCNPTDFHRSWLPVVNAILRDLAWGQTRRVSIAEIAAEFGRLDQTGACTGFEDKICLTLFDGIHPTSDGYTIIREKLWEATGGVQLGADDALGRSSIQDADYGYLRRVRRLLPRNWETRGGAVVDDPEAALDDADSGTPARIGLGNGAEEFRLNGFPDWFDEIRIVRVIAGVRYRTSGPGQPVDDLYRMEASINDEFRPPPGHAYTPTDWNFFTPIVGAGGPSQPTENPDYPNAETLVVPQVPAFRDVSATLSKNPELPAGSSEYLWPSLTHEELATTTIRVASAPEPGAQGDDDYRVDLDYAWLDLYGWEEPRPIEVRDLRMGRLGDGTLLLSFEPLAGAERYNVYQGRLQAARAGAYDHGAAAPAGPLCDASTQPTGDGRLEVELAPSEQTVSDAYFLLTGHVSDVESPAGQGPNAAEIDRSQSICR
jgi:lysophospholipase L1-like esterase